MTQAQYESVSPKKCFILSEVTQEDFLENNEWERLVLYKEKYILADMQIIEFDNEDVITTSIGEVTPDEEEPPQIVDPLSDNETEIFII